MFVAGLPASRRTLLRLRTLFPYTPSIIELSRNARNVNVFIQPPENLGFGSPMIVRSFESIFPSGAVGRPSESGAPPRSRSLTSPGFHDVPEMGFTAAVYATADAESRSRPPALKP